jgi:hypothetical protein
VTPKILLPALVVLYTAWQFFPDGPLAFYVSTGLFVALVSIATRDWPMAVFGSALGLMHSGCGLMYVGDGRSFVCDSGTGLPITSLVLAGGVGLGVHYWRRNAPQ